LLASAARDGDGDPADCPETAAAPGPATLGSTFDRRATASLTSPRSPASTTSADTGPVDPFADEN
jgi:hypothetical protein